MTDVLGGIWDGLYTGAGFFWKTAWALAFGYFFSAAIRVFVFPREAEKYLGRTGPKPISRALGFGFISSSCSFAALSATRSLFAKGASLPNALAFMFASTTWSSSSGSSCGSSSAGTSSSPSTSGRSLWSPRCLRSCA